MSAIPSLLLFFINTNQEKLVGNENSTPQQQ
jgi:hypothetical protein